MSRHTQHPHDDKHPTTKWSTNRSVKRATPPPLLPPSASTLARRAHGVTLWQQVFRKGGGSGGASAVEYVQDVQEFVLLGSWTLKDCARATCKAADGLLTVS